MHRGRGIRVVGIDNIFGVIPEAGTPKLSVAPDLFDGSGGGCSLWPNSNGSPVHGTSEIKSIVNERFYRRRIKR